MLVTNVKSGIVHVMKMKKNQPPRTVCGNKIDYKYSLPFHGEYISCKNCSNTKQGRKYKFNPDYIPKDSELKMKMKNVQLTLF